MRRRQCVLVTTSNIRMGGCQFCVIQGILSRFTSPQQTEGAFSASAHPHAGLGLNDSHPRFLKSLVSSRGPIKLHVASACGHVKLSPAKQLSSGLCHLRSRQCWVVGWRVRGEPKIVVDPQLPCQLEQCLNPVTLVREGQRASGLAEQVPGKMKGP